MDDKGHHSNLAKDIARLIMSYAKETLSISSVHQVAASVAKLVLGVFGTPSGDEGEVLGISDGTIRNRPVSHSRFKPSPADAHRLSRRKKL